MTAFAVVIRGAAVMPGEPVPGATAPHPDAIPDETPADERTCTATTAKGDPCKGRAGDDGLCAAHKEK
jgi:hypothetical protein